MNGSILIFRTKPDGVGIDLVVLKRIMVGHGGNVEVSSKQGEGTTFSLVFPLERRRSIRVCRLDKKKGRFFLAVVLMKGLSAQRLCDLCERHMWTLSGSILKKTHTRNP